MLIEGGGHLLRLLPTMSLWNAEFRSLLDLCRFAFMETIICSPASVNPAYVLTEALALNFMDTSVGKCGNQC